MPTRDGIGHDDRPALFLHPLHGLNPPSWLIRFGIFVRSKRVGNQRLGGQMGLRLAQ